LRFGDIVPERDCAGLYTVFCAEYLSRALFHRTAQRDVGAGF